MDDITKTYKITKDQFNQALINKQPKKQEQFHFKENQAYKPIVMIISAERSLLISLRKSSMNRRKHSYSTSNLVMI